MFGFGIDRLIREPGSIAGRRIALLSHPAGVTSELEPAWKALLRLDGIRLTHLFGPEHGIDGGAQDMAGVADSIHPPTGLRVRSLYGTGLASLSPRDEDLDGVDVLVADLQDVGARFYTFVWTICLAMETCARTGSRLVVCDRPNPLGSSLEGEPQDARFLSFVGRHPVPVRHGMTAGEIALRYRRERGLGVDLEVVRMQGWARSACWPSDRAFVPPSPNMPALSTAAVYPGGCLVEATNLSEGRGTTRPFEQIGAPFLDAERFAEELASLRLPGVVFRPAHFIPTFQKFAGMLCHGVFLHVTDGAAFHPYETGLRLIDVARRQASGEFRWRIEPYEFEARPAIDLLTGSAEFRELLEAGDAIDELCARQQAVVRIADDLLYPDNRPEMVFVIGSHDSGKTTLVEKLIPLFRAGGLRVGSVKHTPHAVDDDLPGKDSARHTAAGAEPSAFVRPAAMTIRRREPEDLRGLLRRDFTDCDLVLVEGFKSQAEAPIVVGRGAPRSVEWLGRDYSEDLRSLVDGVSRRLRLAGSDGR